MTVGRVAMVLLVAALTAACAAPRESGTTDAVSSSGRDAGPVAVAVTESNPASPAAANAPASGQQSGAVQTAGPTADSTTAAAPAPTPGTVRQQAASAGRTPPPQQSARESAPDSGPKAPATVSARTPPQQRAAREHQSGAGPRASGGNVADSVSPRADPGRQQPADADQEHPRRPSLREAETESGAGASARAPAYGLPSGAEQRAQHAAGSVRAPQHAEGTTLATGAAPSSEPPPDAPEEGNLALLREKLDIGDRSTREERELQARAFSRSTIGDCAAIRRLGEAIGFSRGRGASESEAVRDGVDRLAGEFGLPRDQKTKFTGRVYGILLYRLESGHSTQAQASYTHAICRVYHDTRQIIPVDPDSERAINERLRSCDRTTAAREELEDCVLRGLLEIVSRAS